MADVDDSSLPKNEEHLKLKVEDIARKAIDAHFQQLSGYSKYVKWGVGLFVGLAVIASGLGYANLKEYVQTNATAVLDAEIKKKKDELNDLSSRADRLKASFTELEQRRESMALRLAEDTARAELAVSRARSDAAEVSVVASNFFATNAKAKSLVADIEAVGKDVDKLADRLVAKLLDDKDPAAKAIREKLVASVVTDFKDQVDRLTTFSKLVAEVLVRESWPQGPAQKTEIREKSKGL